MVNFKKYGDSKDNLVFLHGWGGRWQLWYPIIERLKNKFTIYIMDLPGFGQNLLSKPYTLADYADFVMHLLRQEKINRPILVGHSFGGTVAVKVTLTYPRSIFRLVLVAASVIRPKKRFQDRSWLAVTKLGKFFLGLPFLKIFSKEGRNWFYKLRNLEGSDYFHLGKNENLKKTFVNILGEDLTKNLHQIKIPTLLIWGKNDKETPASDGEKIHQLIKDSKLLFFPNAGHFPYLDDQEKFCQELEKFARYAS